MTRVPAPPGGAPEVRLEDHAGMRLVGLRRRIPMDPGAIGGLWRAFRPRAAEVEGRRGPGFVALRVPEGPGRPPAPDEPWEQWAAVEVAPGSAAPEGMEVLEVPPGRYAVLEHRGPPSGFPPVARWLHGSWMPAAGLEADVRPHFERIPPHWTPASPDAVEEVWVPVRAAGAGDPPQSSQAFPDGAGGTGPRR